MNTSYRLQPEQFEYLHDILSYISSDKNRYTLKMPGTEIRQCIDVLHSILETGTYVTLQKHFLNNDIRDLHLRIIELSTKDTPVIKPYIQYSKSNPFGYY